MKKGETAAKTRSPKEELRECEYELMMLNQSLGMVPTSSNLGQELITKRAALEQKIAMLEKEVREASTKPKFNPAAKRKAAEGKIWVSGSKVMRLSGDQVTDVSEDEGRDNR